MTELTSAQNPRLQQIRKAAQAGRPLPDGRIVAEGPHLLEDALLSTWRVEKILVTHSAQERFAAVLQRAKTEVTLLSERAFAGLSTTEHSQGLMALLQPRAWNWSDVLKDSALVVVLDALQDPGNVGTVIRSAEAFGATGVVLGEGSVRVANGKLLRAAAGSLFRMPFVENAAPAETIRQLRERGVRLFGLAASGGVRINEANLRDGCALVVGNEGAGLSAEFWEAMEAVRIPTKQVESLNAGVACSIALFEAARQRGNHEPFR